MKHKNTWFDWEALMQCKKREASQTTQWEQWHRLEVPVFLWYSQCHYCTGKHLDSQGNKIYINDKSNSIFIGS